MGKKKRHHEKKILVVLERQMINCFGYLRLSQEDKNKSKKELETAIINYRKQLDRAIEENGWILMQKSKDQKYFEDLYISGSERFRKDFTEMLSRATEGEASILVVPNQDRFCRDVAFFKDTLTDLKACNIKVYDISKKDFLDPDSLSDTVHAVFNEEVISVGKRKTQQLHNMKIEEKRPFIPAPFGYKYNKKKHSKTWIPDSKTMHIPALVLKDYNQKLGYKQICQKHSITPKVYYGIVKNVKKYFGVITYQKKLKDSQGKIVSTETIEYKGEYELLPGITQELKQTFQLLPPQHS